MSIPYTLYTADRLKKCPIVKLGDYIQCTKCGKDHKLIAEVPNSVVLFYYCGDTLYIGASLFEDQYRCTVDIVPSSTGKI